jgi:hypothetical protein
LKQTILIEPEKIAEGIKILKFIQNDIPGASLAGGYLRDAVLGGTPKDIDIFIPYVEPYVIDRVMQSYSAVEMKGAKYMPQQEVTRIWDVVDNYELNPILDTVDSIKTELSNRKLPVQIIMLNKGLNIEERIQQYDFGLCQIWTEGEVTYCTQGFVDDVNNKTCTLIVCEDHTQFQRSMRRFDRFKQRYPELQLKIKDSVPFRENELW